MQRCTAPQLFSMGGISACSCSARVVAWLRGRLVNGLKVQRQLVIDHFANAVDRVHPDVVDLDIRGIQLRIDVAGEVATHC